MTKTLLSCLALAVAAAGGPALGAAPQKNSSNAIVRLLNSRASGSPRDYAEAAETVAADAKAGHPLQQFVLALVADERSAPPAARLTADERKTYLDQSRDKIKALAEKKGNALAWYLLSLENNDVQMLKRAADGDNVQALNAYGTLTLTQALADPDLDRDHRELVLRTSCDCFRRAAERKDPNGLYNLGMCYLQGYGVARDRQLALNCFRTAAEANHPEAINNIGGFYRDGIVVERDPVAATRWFRKSAELGNAYGELNYALALQRGEGVDRDAAKAAEIFRSAAEQGNAAAMNALGMCHFLGDGVAKDARAAVGWYRRAARLGYAPAMDNLSTCASQGVGGLPKSERTATVWKIRGRAARGDSNAMIWLEKNGETLR